MKKILFWFYRQHKQEAISILEAINEPYAGIKPTRKLLMWPYLRDSKKIKKEEDYDRFIKYLKNADYIASSDSGALALTETGKKLLKKYQDFWILRPIKIIQNSLKENLTAIVSFAALVISIISLIKK